MEVHIKRCPDKICRTCLCESTELKSITSKMVGDSRTLLDALNFVVNINVLLGNGLPDQVCSVCETILYKADAFKRRCLESETVLGQQFPVYDQGQVTEELSQKSLVKDEAVLIVNKKELAEPLLPTSELERPSNSSITDFIVHLSESDDKLKLFADITASKQTDEKNNKRNPTEYEQGGLNTVKVEDSIDSDNDQPFDFDHSKSLDSPIEFELKKPCLKMFTCQCGTVCADKDKYRLHLYSTKCGHVKKSTKKRGVKIKSEKPIASRPYIKKKVICPQCGKAFTSVKACNLHQKRYHISVEDAGNYQCNMCQRKFNRKSSYTNHLKHHDLISGVKYICDTCKREFQHKAHLDNHILNVHTRDEGFPCDECMTRFTTQASLDIHKESHKVEKRHVCEICKKAFYMLSTLNDHMRVHTGEKPYLCSICGKGFSQKTNLAQHVRRHQGLKPFKCGDCDRSFVSKGELTAHARSHSGAHPFVCEDCGGGFTTSSSLVKHRRTHTGERPYACDLCPMRFAASGTLKNHRRTHTGEKPFQCSYCEKAFVQRHDLVSHIRGHTGERPYTCSSCGMAFRKASALKAHARLHNKEQRELALLQPAALLASLPAHPASDGGAQA